MKSVTSVNTDYRSCPGFLGLHFSRIMTQESLPSLITLEKICVALGVTLSQFFREENPVDLTESQKEILKIWDNLSTKEQETVLAMLRGLQK